MRAGVAGSPIAHSLSPALHRAAYAALGLTGWRYDAVECDAAGLGALLDGLDDSWVGLSLTMPLKEAVLALLDVVDPLAAAVGACNTVDLHGGVRVGSNTDVAGLVAVLQAHVWAPGQAAVVLGGGATARSAVAALGLAGASAVTVYCRSAAARPALDAAAEASGVALRVAPWEQAVPDAAVVVNTTPAFAADPLVTVVPDHPGLLVDVLYHPWPTALAAAWAARGGAVGSGVDLLVAQAVGQVAVFTGRPVDADQLTPVLRAAAADALAQRSGH